MIIYLKKYQEYFYILTLISIAILAHTEWFNPNSILTFSDWQYWPTETVNTLPWTWSAWFSFGQFGRPNIMLAFYPFKFLWSLITNIGFSYDIATKLTFFIPIALLGFLAPYFLAKELIGKNNRIISFSVALFYASTTFFLIRQASHLTISFLYAFFPIIFLFFIRALRRNTISSWIVFCIFYQIGIFYEIRLMYLGTFMLILYFFCFHIKSIRKYFSNIIKSTLLLILMNSLWLTSTLFGGLSESIKKVANRGLFGNNLFDIFHAITLSESSWTGTYPNMDFVSQSVPEYLWTIPLAFLLILFFSNKDKRYILFFSFIAVLGMFLTKQSGSPIPDLYLWLYKNFPGFNLFREASKFYFITAVGLFGVFVFGLHSIQNKKFLYRILISTLILVSFMNLKPLFTKEIDTLFVSRQIPDDYISFQNLITQDGASFRTLWIPSTSRWGYFDMTHSKISGMNSIFSEWKDFLPFDDTYNTTLPLWNRALWILDQPFSNFLIDSSSIKYVVVPTRDRENNNDIFRFYDADRKEYIHELSDIKYLHHKSEFNDLYVLENPEYKPQITALRNVFNLKNIKDYGAFTETIASKYSFEPYFTVQPEQSPIPFINVYGLFNKLDPNNIQKNTISENLNVENGKNIKLFLSNKDISGDKVQIKLNDDFICEECLGETKVETRSVEQSGVLRFSAVQNKIFQNLIINGDFSSGMWPKKIAICSNYGLNYDRNAFISEDSSNKFLQLNTEKQDTCASPDTFSVSQDKPYIFTFDYQSDNTRNIGYGIFFNDDANTKIRETIPVQGKNWHTFTRKVQVPKNATTASLVVYGYSEKNKTDIVTRYDNFSFIELPDIADRYYLVSDPETNFVEPREITFDLVNPTKKLVHIKGATTPFYLAMSESYHPEWQAHLSNAKIGTEVKSEKSKVKSKNESFYSRFFASWIPWVKPDVISNDHHFELNGFLNGWYVDPSALCAEVEGQKSITSKVGNENSENTFDFGLSTLDSSRLKDGCTQNPDGSYDIELTLEFFPQRWFYLGLLISGTTLLACLGYLAYDFARRRKNKQ